MGDALKKVQPGQKLRIPATAYNAFVDAAQDLQNRRHGQHQRPASTHRSTGIVLVKNATGSDLSRFAVVGLASPIFTATESLISFQNQPAFNGVVPAIAHWGRFAILSEPLASGMIGRAVISGISPVQVDFPDEKTTYRYADVDGGQTTRLLAAHTGAAQILWHEPVPNGGGTVWCYVRLSNRPIVRVYALDDCLGLSETLFVTNDLEDQIGRVVKVGDTCYTVRAATPEEARCQQPQCVEVVNDYDSCDRCNACWFLTPCVEGQGAQTVTNTDLADFEGRVVLLDDGYLYQVSKADDCTDNAGPVDVLEDYEDCDAAKSAYHLENCFDDTDTLDIRNDLTKSFELTPAEIVAAEAVVTINGLCYKVAGYDETWEEAEVEEIDAVYASCGECGCFKLTNCNDPLDVRYVRRATGPGGGLLKLANYVDRVVRDEDGQVYRVEATDECEDLETAIAIIEAYDDCETATCYTLAECGNEANTILTYSDLAGRVPGGVAVGDVVKVAGTCYTITTDAAEFDGTAMAVVVQSKHATCAVCQGTQKYKLANSCNRPECGGDAFPDKITTQDLSAALGKHVKIDGVCYAVSEVGAGDVTDATVSYTGPFDSCQECLASPIVAVVPYLVPTPYIDGSDWKYPVEKLIISGGDIVGRCRGEAVTVEGTECET